MNTVYCQNPHIDPLRAQAICQNQKTLSIAVWISPVHLSNKLVCYDCCWEERERAGVRGFIYDAVLSFHRYPALCLAQQLCRSPMKLPLLMQLTVHLWLSRDLTLSFWPVIHNTYVLPSPYLKNSMVGAGKWTWILRRKSQCS